MALSSGGQVLSRLARLLGVTFLSLMGTIPPVQAAGDDDFDSYKLKMNGYLFYSNPLGNFRSSANEGILESQRSWTCLIPTRP